jgi:hypothetical protein
VKKGWVVVGERGQLALVPGMSKHFEEFDIETITRFHDASRYFTQQVKRRSRERPASA